jgi:hypothetical protein
MKLCYKWSNCNVLWSKANWTFSECQIIQDLLTLQPAGVDATTLIQPWLIEPWNPYRAGEKKKKLVRLICKVKGIEYDESKMAKNYTVTVDDIKLVIAKGKEIGIGMKLEE